MPIGKRFSLELSTMRPLPMRRRLLAAYSTFGWLAFETAAEINCWKLLRACSLFASFSATPPFDTKVPSDAPFSNFMIGT